MLLVAAAAGFAWVAWKAKAQDTAAVPVLPQGAAPIIQLEQAQISDATIVAYIKSTGNSYSLNAGQIIYLRQQGVSEAVIAAMLAQSNGTATPAVVPPPAPVAAPVPDISTVVPAAAPATVTYVQTAPVACYYPYYPAGYYYYGWPHPLLHPWVGVGWGGHGGWHVGVAF